MHARWQSFKAIVKLWVDVFDRHNLLTYASAIALRSFIAAVACVLFGLGLLGALHEQRLWVHTIGPQIAPRVLPGVRFDLQRPPSRRKLLPLVAGVVRDASAG